MPADVTIIAHEEPSPMDRRLAHLVDFLGLRSKIICHRTGDAIAQLVASTPSTCLAVSARAVAAMLPADPAADHAMVRLLESVPAVLVYGISSDLQDARALSGLTEGAVSSVVSFGRDDTVYSVGSTVPAITEEFSGLSFGPIRRETDCGLAFGRRPAGLGELVSIDGLPLFALLRKPTSSLFLLACRDVADVAAPTDGILSADAYFSSLVPILMFIRYALGDRSWHVPQRYANLIIDDPLLQPSYGCVEYTRLLDEMDTYRFATTIAFIPWNYRRTDASIGKLFRSRLDRFSLCVHGCDHTAAEFGTTDGEHLNSLLHLATQRMQAHKQRTGVSYANVMVFPHGKFSTMSLRLLKSHNYLAATDRWVPDDVGSNHGLTLADLLLPAISKYHDFPLFRRRSPGRVADFALDLFLGKPALIAEHHGCFRDGYVPIRQFATRLNSLSQRLQWTGLSELVHNTYLRRRLSEDAIECRLVANRHTLHNPGSTWQRCFVSKHEDHTVPIKSVFINGTPHLFTVDDNWLRACVDMPPHSTMAISIEYANTWPSVRRSPPLTRSVSVYVRRHLSELKDNYLYANQTVLSLVDRATAHARARRRPRPS
jgi:hypothetical protein